MDLKEALLREHSKTQTNKIIKFIGNDKSRFNKLVEIFLKGEYRITQRAAWPLSYVAIKHPELIKPFFLKLVKKLSEPDNHPAITRNILRIFEEVEIPEKYHGVLINSCIKFIMDVKYPIAIRAFAITVAAKICIHYPDLKRELILILVELKKYPQQPAIIVRIRNAFEMLSFKSF